nr:aspartate/glutamate racemase family protein [uncultured Oscillibacter sp.]
MYGDKGRIGLIRPGITPSTEMDFHRHLPEGMALATAALPYQRVTLDGLSRMSDQVREYAGMYRGFPFDILVFACTTGSMVGGPGFDQTLIRQMEEASGIPSITTSTALMQAFSFLGLKKLAIVTPYSDALNRLEVEFLAAAGYETTAIKGLDIEDTAVLPFVRPREFRRLALEQDTSDADALFISCTGICAVDLVEPLEDAKGIPVLTSNQATIWYALRRMGYQEPLPGLGTLGRRPYPM